MCSPQQPLDSSRVRFAPCGGSRLEDPVGRFEKRCSPSNCSSFAAATRRQRGLGDNPSSHPRSDVTPRPHSWPLPHREGYVLAPRARKSPTSGRRPHHAAAGERRIARCPSAPFTPPPAEPTARCRSRAPKGKRNPHPGFRAEPQQPAARPGSARSRFEPCSTMAPQRPAAAECVTIRSLARTLAAASSPAIIRSSGWWFGERSPR